ncbi:MAG TPA: hypothetical protein VGM88_07580 [Kofleriaceae bacterium]
MLLVLAACCPTHRTTTAPTPVATAPVAPPPAPAPETVSLDTLAPSTSTHGFTPTAVYLDAAGHAMGARFVHDTTGFTFDYVRIESAPQGFIYVTTYPTSDKGEPHTQEHLLLGKGDHGRKLGSFEAMALAESSAFTDQWRTAYHFHTVAGNAEFWPVFEDELDALVNPDYTDEEIRREVRNFGVDKGPGGKLRLEEKGTVYNEMVRSYEAGDTVVWHEALRLIYGAHPLAFESGGYPEAIRTMLPADIRKFHDATYHLANMGMVGAFPGAMPLGDVLDQTGKILDKIGVKPGIVVKEAQLPAPQPAAPGTIAGVPYPYSDTTSPSPEIIAWPATRNLDANDRVLISLFLASFAGDESTNLYKKLIDSKTRVLDVGASGVSAYASEDQGEPVFVWINGVKADKLDDKTLAQVRDIVTAELAHIAALPDGDPELVAFDKRVASRVIDIRRRFAKLTDTPPGFGRRGTGSDWINQLSFLERVTGFKKSLGLGPELAHADSVLAGTVNPWRTRLKTWGLLGTTPFALAARPSPALRKQTDDDRAKRVTDELARLEAKYGVKTADAALAAYAKDYDAATATIEEATKQTPLPPLVDTPPMTYDDTLRSSAEPVGGVPAFHATVDSMQSSRVSLAFRVDGVAEEDLVYLAALPALLSEVGIADDQGVIASDEQRERIRKEILELSVYYATSLVTGRAELVASGAGNDAAETKLALGWIRRVLLSPDWRPANLPRLRDLVDHQVTQLREQMQQAEEAWVRDPHDAWWRQAWPQYLHTSSFLTRAHDLHRLRWMLMDPGNAKVTAEATAYLDALAKQGAQPRAKLEALVRKPPAGTLSPDAKKLAQAALDDLKALIPDLPDGSLAADWTYLCRQMSHDLAQGAPATLAKLAAVRQAVVTAGAARIVEVGSSASRAAIRPELEGLVAALPKSAFAAKTYGATPLVSARLRDHDKGSPLYVGLVDPGTSSGVFINNVKSTSPADTSDAAVIDYLASSTYSGHGAHSVFMKTWAAGLAYSNGVHPFLELSTLEYYAERCPLLPQTLKFVIDTLKGGQVDGSIARYALTNAFTSRIADAYEERAWEQAWDNLEGNTPEVVRAFRTRVLSFAKRDDLAQLLAARMPEVYGRILPGWKPPAADGVYFVIGPKKQLDAYQEYLHAAVGKTAALHRLYPRDYWIPAKL